MTVDSKKVIEYYAKRMSTANWEVVDQRENGIQIRQIKKVNWLGIWSGLFLLPFWGIGLIVWLLVLLDYVLQREKIKFITVEQMIEQLKRNK